MWILGRGIDSEYQAWDGVLILSIRHGYGYDWMSEMIGYKEGMPANWRCGSIEEGESTRECT